MGSTSANTGTVVKPLDRSFDPALLFDFLMRHGQSEFNWLPETGVRQEFKGIATGATMAWVAMVQDELVGFITAHPGGQFAINNRDYPTAEIGEFVVAPQYRGQGIGTSLAVAARNGVFAQYSPAVRDLYVMTHANNERSARCFRHAGFKDVLTFGDIGRGRSSRVLRVTRPMRIAGIQSGNAVDGIDVCIVEFDEPVLNNLEERDVGGLQYRVLAFEIIPWSNDMREAILMLRDGTSPPCEYARQNYSIAEAFADAVLVVLGNHGIELASIDLVSSHGQSVLGHPHWELGELAVLAERLGVTTVGDFRPADVAAGGNGSPCTCTYDALMLRPAKGSHEWRICINIGGTTSVTFCPPEGSDVAPTGLDTGLGVFFMDLHARLAIPGSAYDDGGALAARGTVEERLLTEMLGHPFFRRTRLPITIGPEDFPRSTFNDWHSQSLESGCSPADFQATLTELTARSIANACKRFGVTSSDVLVRGGVRKNRYFMERLRINLSASLEIGIPELRGLADLGIDEESWETAMYAMFGYLCVRGLHNFVPSCTGASHPVIGGKICPGGNFQAVQWL